MLLGFAIEGVATMLCRLASKLLSDGEPQFAAAIDSFVATALVVAAFDYSGGYYNPVLATGLKFVSEAYQDTRSMVYMGQHRNFVMGSLRTHSKPYRPMDIIHIFIKSHMYSSV